jgi:hypothetical protein
MKMDAKRYTVTQTVTLVLEVIAKTDEEAKALAKDELRGYRVCGEIDDDLSVILPATLDPAIAGSEALQPWT